MMKEGSDNEERDEGWAVVSLSPLAAGMLTKGGIPSQMTFVDTEAFLYCTRELLIKQTYNYIIEGMHTEIASWKAKSLSLVG